MNLAAWSLMLRKITRATSKWFRKLYERMDMVVGEVLAWTGDTPVGVQS